MKKLFTLTKLYILLDITIIFGITFLGFLGSYSKDAFASSLTGILLYCSGTALITVVIFAFVKLYRTQYDDYCLTDRIKVAIGYSISALIGLIVLFAVKELHFTTKHIITWLLTSLAILLLLIFIRDLPREIKVVQRMNEKRKLGVRTMLIGAGAAAKIVIDDLKNNPKSENNIVVLVDDDEKKFGTPYFNIDVVGPISNVSKIAKEYEIEEAIIAIANLTEERFREIVDCLSACNVRVRRLPLLSEISSRKDIKVTDVHIEELLNRDPIKLDNTEVNEMLRGKTVLVTGGGGSIGSELMRQIFKMHPKKLIVFDIYENCTYDIQQELIRKMRKENINDIELIALIGSTYNETSVEQIIKKYKPDYIYHAAAYKHVPLMEDCPIEAIRTNVIGTYNVAKFADKYKVKKMVLISTDKAVRPTNTMGATKRFAETIIQYFSEKSKNTAYAAVRFGNVLGSNGSVVPLFKKQIEEGGPITLTHKDIVRYFMTIPEAVSLILQCGLYAEGGEIFILDMGKPVKIYDLAIKLIRQAGLVPDKDIKIIETGLRPGEKLFEELLLDVNTQTRTKNERIFVEEKESIKPIEEEIRTISNVFNMEETTDVKKLLASIIETYTIDKDDK
ncbi:MAG: polysaccharide biosynthesis protein [Bacilli bacterium]|nr:polysaccharide biosynthesis protein [Bacilli bacterium]